MGPPLQKAPLIEALCELRFAEETPWNDDVVVRVQGLLAPAYPTRDRRDPKRQPPLEQLKSADGAELIQIGERLIVINQSRAYPGWPAFRARIATAANALQELPLPAPISVGLEYVNLLHPSAGLEQLLRRPPQLRDDLGELLLGFYCRQSFGRSSPDGVLTETVGTGQASQEEGLLFDLTFECPETTPWTELEARLEAMHAVIHDAFVASLTDEAYNELRGAEP